MGSQVVVVGARVCDDDGDVRQSDAVLGFSGAKVDDFSSFVSNRGTCIASGSLSWTKKQDTELHRSNYLVSRSITEDASRGLDHGLANGSVALINGLEGNQAQRRVGKVPRNGSGSFKKPRMFQTDNILPLADNDDAKMEVDVLGTNFVNNSNTDKTQAVKQRNNINGKRADRRNSKLPMKAKFDSFSPKAGMSSFSPAAGGNYAFGMYGLKPDVHDVTKLMVDISLDELLDGTYQCPTIGKDERTRTPSLNNNVLDSVRKVFSLIRPQGLQQDKQTEELDIQAIKKIPSSSSPSSNSVENVSDGDGNTTDGLSKCNKSLDCCVKAEVSTDLCDSPLYQPREVLERLVLPPPKDLESLLQDAVKPAASMKFPDSRSSKQLSHRLNFPPFPWSQNFNGHYKSNNDAHKTSNKSTCSGRWVKISSTASFIGGSTNGFVGLESLTYDDSLVPTGQLKYSLPEVGKSSTIITSLQDVSPAPYPGNFQPPLALNSPKVLAAARTLCDMASPSTKHKSSGILKWSKQASQKAIKARKSRLDEIPEEGFLAPKSETVLDHVIKSVEYGSSSKKPKISLVDRREDYSHVQAVIGLSSVSAPRSKSSNRSSPNSLSRDFSCVKSSFRVPPPPRVLDRSSQNPQKTRKITPVDWNRTRS
ncbi:uncharacterized protein LOC141587234 [Silene latifolia]|uniref:uncharacterized protein LOC141587234 n=1 Tax=Silene latifolia TaxID=37657 RepID=UPI003D777F8C